MPTADGTKGTFLLPMVTVGSHTRSTNVGDLVDWGASSVLLRASRTRPLLAWFRLARASGASGALVRSSSKAARSMECVASEFAAEMVVRN